MGNYLIFFAGVLTSTLLFVIIKQYNKRRQAKRIVIRQSDIYSVLRQFLGKDYFDLHLDNTQASIYDSSKIFKYVELSDNKAYWLDKNKVYYTDIKNGYFDPANGKLMQTKDLSEEEVGKVVFIFNSLKKG